MYAEGVLAELPFELAHRFEKRCGLYVADGAPYLGDDEVVFSGEAEALDVSLDFVGDVRHDLDCLAEIVAPSLLVDDRLIDAAGGEVVGAGGLDVGESFVVTQVQVCLMAVYGDVTFTVLVGVEGAGVDVDVGVELLDCYLESSGEEEAGER